MAIVSIGGIFLIIFGGIKYRQESRKIKEEGKSSSNPLLWLINHPDLRSG